MSVRGLCVFAAAIVGCVGSGGLASGDQPPLLNLDTGTSGSLLVGGVSAGAQDVQLDAVNRGVTAGGASRVGSLFGWALNADPGAVDEVGSRMLGPIDLVTGAVTYSDTQLVLPAYASWPIGFSYYSGQTSGHVGGGMQGKNWFQDSQPSITYPDSNGIIRVFYSADAFVEYKEVGSSYYYVAVNGAGGVMHLETITVDGETAQVYKLIDQSGNEIVFFGWAYETAVVNAGAMGQFWKYTVGAGTGGSTATAYAGHPTKPLTAATDGYSGGHIILARDSAGRRFDYGYTSIGGADRLTSVTAKAAGSSPPTIATVEYSYYGQSGIPTGDNGSAGDLASVRVTLPTSFGASGSLAAIQDVRENRFYYDSGSRLKLVLGYEGTRRYLVAAGSSPMAWDANATTLAAALNAYAEVRVSYPSSGVKVGSAWFAGMDGSTGSTPELSQPQGEHQLTYENHGSYSTSWEWRTIVKFPAFNRYTGSNLGTPSEASGNAWATQYFDVLGQPLHSVDSDIDPASTSATPKYWVRGMDRDSDHRLTALRSPANCSAYNHNATSSSRGSYTTTAGNGVVTSFERATSGKYIGMVEGVRRGTGGSSDSYLSWTEYTNQSVTLSSSPLISLLRPFVRASRTYPTVTTDHTTSGSYDRTEFTYDFWSTSCVTPLTLTTTLPAVDEAHNGSGTSDTRKTWFNHFGQAIVTRQPNGRLDTIEYDADSGLTTRTVRDATTPTSTAFPDLPSGDMPAATAIGGESSSSAYNITSEYQYDQLGRMKELLKNANLTDAAIRSQTYYTRLNDRRIVRVDVPSVDATASTPVYYGPFSLSVINHLGVVEEAGQLSPSNPLTQAPYDPSSFTTTDEPRSWLAEPSSTLGDDFLAKAAYHSGGAPGLVSLSAAFTSRDGSRIVEARSYTRVPTSGSTVAAWRGSLNTSSNNNHFDRTLARYNGMGLVDRTVDATDTIDSFRFDVLGRVVRHERGTNDDLVTGTDNMRPRSSTVFDGAGYAGTATNLNIAGSDGRLTEVIQHPAGSYNAANDIHSCIRYDALGNPLNIWSEDGPFLAASVDNLGRTTAAAQYDGTWSSWTGATSMIAPTANDTGSNEYRRRYAKSFYDELGRVYKQSTPALNPSTGGELSTAGEQVDINRYFGANGVLKSVDGTTPTMYARNRLCQVKTAAIVASNWSSSASASDRIAAMRAADLSSQIIISQTNTYYAPNHRNVVAVVGAQRGVAPIDPDGKVDSGGPPSVRGPLMDIPNTSTTGWLTIGTDSDSLNMALTTGTAPSWLLLNVQTTDHDRWLDVPVRTRNFGDPLRRTSYPHEICCGASCGPSTTFPAGNAMPFVQTDVEYDPRRVICKTTTSDWESGDRSIRATLFNAAGQPVRSMAIKQRFNPAAGGSGLPAVPEDQAPLSTGGCCDTAESMEWEWDKARLKLEKMFPCSLPDPNTSTPEYEFNPLSLSSYCGSTSSCPKTVSYGYPDYPTAAGDTYPWSHSDPAPYPNDNTRVMWTVKPIGASPDLGWHQGNASGSDDADWFVYDELGRTIRRYGNQYRKPNFGDGNAAPSPMDQIFWSRGGYPTEVVRPSGDNSKAHEHTVTKRDMLGRPITVSHILDTVSTPEDGLSPAWDDEMELSYDRFGLLGQVKQKFKGMFPSSCGPTGDWITFGLEREGTPQQSVTLDGRALSPWQGPRVVRQTLPAGKVLGMAYFPNPAGTTDSAMFGASGVDDKLTPSRLDWALGRTSGLFEGTGTDPFDVPVSRYGYLGMALPLHRYLPGLGLDKWQMLPSDVAPSSDGESHTSFVPQTRRGPDWRHRLRDDLWGRPMDANPAYIPPQAAFRVEGHEDIKWLGNAITSFLDPATSPDFGTSGLSPVAGFTVHGHDEYFRRDCTGKTIYWLSGQASKWSIGSAATAWGNGVSSPIGVNSATASAPVGVSEAEFRWPTPETGCGSAGTGGWLMSPHGEFSVEHPLSPRGIVIGGEAEWANHPVVAESETCSPYGINGRFYQTDRQYSTSSATGSVSHWPFSNGYDAAGNLTEDSRNYYEYDGSNRLRNVYARGFSGSTPVKGNRTAHFEYDGLGQLVKAQYNSDGDTSLDDEDIEWTPRDPLGRPLGIWRQGPVSGGVRPCSTPYQLFGYHSTSFRGTGYDASSGIVDCPAVRWRDTDGNASNGFEEELFYLQDFRGDVTGVGSDTKLGILERVRYGPTGRPEVFPAADVNFDGEVNDQDETDFLAALGAFSSDPEDYDPRADLNKDGVIDSTDEDAFYSSFDKTEKTAGNWRLSQGIGLAPGQEASKAGLDNRFGWRGYWYDSKLQKYHVRNRVYDPREGRWMQTDPLGYAAGDSDLYRYCFGEYSTGYDPMGLDGTYYSTATYVIPEGATPETPPCEQQQYEFGDPNAGNRHYDDALNFGTGMADVLSFGMSYLARSAYGGNDHLDTSSPAYQGGVAAGAATLATIVTGGAAAGYLGGGAALTGGQMMAVGAFAGYSGSVIGQGVEMAQGRRNSVDLQAVAFDTMMGAALGGGLYYAGRWINATMAARIRQAAPTGQGGGACQSLGGSQLEADVLQARAARLNATRGYWGTRNGTTAVAEVVNLETGEVQIWIATESPVMPPEMSLQPNEVYISGSGHAEEKIVGALGNDWVMTNIGTSRNICAGTCSPALNSAGVGLGGPQFRGAADKTPYRMGWRRGE